MHFLSINTVHNQIPRMGGGNLFKKFFYLCLFALFFRKFFKNLGKKLRGAKAILLFIQIFFVRTFRIGTFRTNFTYRYFSYKSFVRTFRYLIINKIRLLTRKNLIQFSLFFFKTTKNIFFT